jgi:hypothetical protein
MGMHSSRKLQLEHATLMAWQFNGAVLLTAGKLGAFTSTVVGTLELTSMAYLLIHIKLSSAPISVDLIQVKERRIQLVQSTGTPLG